jgi:hypothetical protein
MGEILFKIWYAVALLPYYIAVESYHMAKKFMNKHGYSLHWTYFVLAILIVVLIILLLLQYGYN